ncbi:MAG: hypothetical protein IPK52_18230 [Chloroflexi bacterium]|nr:hypothetical protein [Chloroflexota bacterium]
MIRWGFRALVIVYLLLPIAAVVIGITTVRSITSTLVPIYDAASERINDAADALDEEFDDLKENFQPLVNAVNAIRTALSRVRQFINNQVNRVINFANGFPGVDIPAFDGFDLPDLINLNFLNNVGGHIRDITGELGDAAAATRDFFAEQASQIGLIGLLMVGWFLVGHLLGAIVIVRNFWR